MQGYINTLIKKSKKTFFYCFLALICMEIIFPNLSLANETDYFPPALGPVISLEGGSNGIPTPHGRKNGFAMNKIPNVGLALYLPLSLEWNLGLNCDLTYSSHSFMMKYNYSKKKDEYLTKDRFEFRYISLASTFSHAGLNIGFALGVPVGGSYEKVDISETKLSTIWEIRAGWTYPIYYDETGKFNFYINATYALNGVYKHFAEDDPLHNLAPAVPPQEITDYYNPRPAGIQIGFNFLFNLIELPDEYYE